MKKIITILLLAIMSLSAGTVGEGAKDPRHFGKLFFDYTIGGETFFEYITVGSRKYMVLDARVVKQLKAGTRGMNFTIKGRIEVPEYIQGDKVMVNTPVFGLDRYININLYLWGKQIKTVDNTVKVMSDATGNRYINFELRGKVDYSDVASALVPDLPKFKVSIAPAKKKRGEPFAWEKAKFYVIEE